MITPFGMRRHRSFNSVGDKGERPNPSSTISAILIASCDRHGILYRRNISKLKLTSLYMFPAARIRILTWDKTFFVWSSTSSVVIALQARLCDGQIKDGKRSYMEVL
jgi:hypothetical protein